MLQMWWAIFEFYQNATGLHDSYNYMKMEVSCSGLSLNLWLVGIWTVCLTGTSVNLRPTSIMLPDSQTIQLPQSTGALLVYSFNFSGLSLTHP